MSLQAPLCMDTIKLNNVTFINNTSVGDGGALYLSKMSSTNLNATDLKFMDNKVSMPQQSFYRTLHAQIVHIILIIRAEDNDLC